MARGQYRDSPESERYKDTPESQSRVSLDSTATMSDTSIVLEHLSDHPERHLARPANKADPETPLMHDTEEKYDQEDGGYLAPEKGPSRTVRGVLWAMCGLCLAGWLLALFLFLRQGTAGTYTYRGAPANATRAANSTVSIELDLTKQQPVQANPRAVQFDEVLEGRWYPSRQSISWIKAPDGKDGMIMERARNGRSDYLQVEDVRSRKDEAKGTEHKTLMRSRSFRVDGKTVIPRDVWPSPDFKKVLVMSEKQKNWRHSFVGKYWIFDVEKQSAEPLDPKNVDGRVQLATWAPTSDAIVFTRDNNMFLRKIDSKDVVEITKDGGADTFYGVPDWVYEEEVFQTNRATWFSDDGQYVAFLRTNETNVPDYPVQYFVSRPSGKKPESGLENYPEVREIKYPKAGAPNPIVDLKFYDVKKKEVFDVKIDGDYPDNDRLITEIVWAGKDGQVLLRETNRESDKLKVVLIDVKKRSGKTVRDEDIKGLDGGWFEVSQDTKFVPKDPAKGRPEDGYIDTIVHDGYDHLAYFSPLDSSKPINLTSGKWEVVKAPSSVDLDNNLVYFVAAKKGPIHRHVYSVNLNGTDLKTLTDDNVDGYYDVSFSAGSGYALLSYKGPEIPHQKFISTASLKSEDKFELMIEENQRLAKMAKEHDLPQKVFSTITVDGFELQVVERRPPNFDEKKKYPVVFFLYNGPASQKVDKKFEVDFQMYMASNLGFLVVTVDGRGTGFSGRRLRCAIRGNIGQYESHDQIEAAKIWKAKPYVDGERIAIWGWSYGGFLTLKTLELDAGRTFKYGMAVAPVTDWRFYDSVYTERYMHTPQHNPGGYDNATITNTTGLAQNVRWLMMHGVADDNVHFQNSLTLLDRLDLAGVTNYDFHAFPDSDHSIFFHNANKMVYGREPTLS